MNKKNLLTLTFVLISSLIFSQTGTTTTHTINVNGTNRTFHVYVPNSYDGSKPVPLMLNIHGYSMSDASQQNQLNYEPIADTANFIVVRPRGTGNPIAWSQATTVSSGQGDRNFIWNMIDSMKAWHNINPCKIYSSGFSQGSFMSNILVINVDNPSRAPVIAAIGSSSGGISKSGNPSYWNSKNPTHPVPVLHIHGTSDNTISYNGGSTQNPASVDELMDFWVTHNNCNATPTMTTCGSVDHYVWDGGDRGTRVEHYKNNGGGHSAVNNTCMNSAKVIWEFCRQFCLPYLTSTTCTEEPTITTQPTNNTISDGGNTSFGVVAAGCEGTPITYQWQVNTGAGFSNLAESAPYSGVKTATLSITSATTSMNTYAYRVKIASCCDNAISDTATLTVNGGTAPTITGTTDNARCGEGTVVLGAIASAGTINWYDTIMAGTSLGTGTTFTTPSISSTSIYYVDATDAGNTTSTRTAITATIKETPTAVISGRDTICRGDTATISIALTGTSPWDVVYKINSIDQDTIMSITAAPYTFTTSTLGLYTLTAVEDSTCIGTVDGEGLIGEIDTIWVSDLVKTCNDEGTKYTVAFNIKGGRGNDYVVTGNAGTLTGNSFVSDSIDSGTAYEFFISDGTSCGKDTLKGDHDCSTQTCSASAVIMGNDSICSGDTATISINLTGTAPWDLIYKFNGSPQDAVIGIISSPFTFTTSTVGVYTLSVVEDSTCKGTVSGQVVITGSTGCDTTPTCAATAIISGRDTICNGDKATISIALTGTAPWNVVYKIDGTKQDSINGITASPYTFTTTTLGIYTLSSVNDNSCSGSIDGEAVITKREGIETSDVVKTCNDAGTKYIVAFNIHGGNADNYVIVGNTGTLSANSFISDSIDAGTAFEFYISSTGSSCVSDTLIGTNDCRTDSCSATAIISGRDTICSTDTATISITLTGTAPWDVVYKIDGTPQDAIIGITASPYTFTTSTRGVYTLSVVEDSTCTGSVDGEAIISEPEGLNISEVEKNCNNAGTKYIVTFNINGGNGTDYAVSGYSGTLTGNNFVSDSIDSGTTFEFFITDGTSCGLDTLTGTKDCGGSTSPTCAASAVITGDAEICEGDTASLTISFAGNGPWSFAYKINNGTTITGTSSSPTYTFSTSTAGIYKVSYVSDNSTCAGTTTGDATVIVNSNPTVGSMVSPNDSICEGESVTFIGTGAVTYAWSSGVSNGVAFTPFSTATYTVTGTDGNNCKGTARQTVTIASCSMVGINENNDIEYSSIFPNPTSGNFIVNVSNKNISKLNISIVNVLGKEIYNSSFDTNRNEINIPINIGGNSSGIYYIKIATGNAMEIKKLILQ